MLTEVRAANVRILRSLNVLPTEFDLCSERIRAIEAKKPKKFPTFWSKFVRTFALTSERIIRGPASHGGQLVAAWFSYGCTYVFPYFRGDFVVYKVSPHVAFAKNVTHFCHSLCSRTASPFQHIACLKF